MGWRGTAILVLLIVVIGGIVYLDETPTPAPDGAGAVPAEVRTPAALQTVVPLLDFRLAEVTSVRLEQDNDARQAERRDGTWQGTTNAAAIDDFLRSLAQLGAIAEISTTASDLGDYGLQPPRAVVRVQVQGRAAPLVMQLGEHNPATTGVYVRLGENGPVVLAGSLVSWEFDKAFKALGTPPAKPAAGA